MRHGLLFTLLLVLRASASGAATLPPGFTESPVASGLSNPTAMAIAPDGRIFVCEQGGALRVIKNGVLLPTPFTTVTVNSVSERGLLGVAIDPAFDSNHFVYVYYTATTPTIHNRVSRFTANGDVAVPGETPILDLENLSAGNHNGGAIHFGPDGKLYVAVGENAVQSNSQTLSNRLGKMLRINADGTIPLDNPFFGTATDANQAIWALGLRNPFTFAFNPGGPEMFINDVGASSFEEINDGVPAANYGWPETEGPTMDPDFRSPRYAYDHDEGCAISGGAFYSPTTIQFPSDYSSDYFFADVCGGWIKRLDLSTNDVTTFATGIAAPVDVHVGGDGSLYYLARGPGSNSGVVNRVQFTPLAPTLNAFTNGLTLSLSWSSSVGATSYRLEAGTASGAADLLNIDVGNITSIESVAPAGTYFIRVRAVGTLGPSATSNEATVRLVGPGVCATPPPPPTGYAAQTAGLNVVLSWNASPSATFYVLEAGSVSGAADIAQASVGSVTSLATTAPPGTYFTRLRAANACGASAPSPEVPLTLSCTTSSPSNLRVVKAGSIVTFTWTAAPGATSYRAQIGSAPGLSNLVNVDIGAGTAVSATIDGAPAGSYFVRIAANTPCGATGPSNEVTVVVP